MSGTYLLYLNVIEDKGKGINYNAYNGLKCPLKLISGARFKFVLIISHI